jgi:hypothetical protein
MAFKGTKHIYVTVMTMNEGIKNYKMMAMKKCYNF